MYFFFCFYSTHNNEIRNIQVLFPSLSIFEKYQTVNFKSKYFLKLSNQVCNLCITVNILASAKMI